MLDSILIATSGLSGHQKGLKTISDNVANMNTPGFKSGRPQFADVFLSEAGDPRNETSNPLPGGGLDILRTTTSFAAGDIRETGRDLDMAIDGADFFVLRNERGETFFTKSGRFEFNPAGRLVSTENGHEVMSLKGQQLAGPLELGSLGTNPPKISTLVTFSGNLTSNVSSTADTVHNIENIKVYDAQGGEHVLKLKLVSNPTSGSGVWQVTVTEGVNTLSTVGQQLRLIGSTPDPTASEVVVTIQSPDGRLTPVALRLGADVTGFSTGTSSTLVVKSSDGYGPGSATKISFNDLGVLTVNYSNGQVSTGGQIALAQFVSTDDLQTVSGALFEQRGATKPRYVASGVNSKLRAAYLELSNVDLTGQFSDLILIQRGYQASSQVLSTASEMIQDLYEMKSR